jgi:hypothetical protein
MLNDIEELKKRLKDKVDCSLLDEEIQRFKELIN